MTVDDKNMNSQAPRHSISTINTVICSLLDFHGAVKDEIELQWPACFPDVAYSVWVDMVVGGGRQARIGLKESRFPRGGGWRLDGNVETGVINLQMGEGALGSRVSVSCLCMVGCFVMAPPHLPHPGPLGPSFILIYELPHGHSALLYHLCIDPSRSTRSSAAAGELYARSYKRRGVCVCA